MQAYTVTMTEFCSKCEKLIFFLPEVVWSNVSSSITGCGTTLRTDFP